MIKTFATALVCVASVVSMATPRRLVRRAPAVPAVVRAARPATSAAGPSSAAGIDRAGVSGGASGSTSQPRPTIDINRAQQPGIGVNSGASGNGSIKPLGR
jgi:hypothetical protein